MAHNCKPRTQDHVGPPLKYDSPTVKLSITFDPDVLEWIEKRGGARGKSGVVNKTLREAMRSPPDVFSEE